jgi:hypothetical protein
VHFENEKIFSATLKNALAFYNDGVVAVNSKVGLALGLWKATMQNLGFEIQQADS